MTILQVGAINLQVKILVKYVGKTLTVEMDLAMEHLMKCVILKVHVPIIALWKLVVSVLRTPHVEMVLACLMKIFIALIQMVFAPKKQARILVYHVGNLQIVEMVFAMEICHLDVHLKELVKSVVLKILVNVALSMVNVEMENVWKQIFIVVDHQAGVNKKLIIIVKLVGLMMTVKMDNVFLKKIQNVLEQGGV